MLLNCDSRRRCSTYLKMKTVTVRFSSTCSLLHRENLVSISGSVLMENKLWTKTDTKKEILEQASDFNYLLFRIS